MCLGFVVAQGDENQVTNSTFKREKSRTWVQGCDWCFEEGLGLCNKTGLGRVSQGGDSNNTYRSMWTRKFQAQRSPGGCILSLLNRLHQGVVVWAQDRKIAGQPVKAASAKNLDLTM